MRTDLVLHVENGKKIPYTGACLSGLWHEGSEGCYKDYGKITAIEVPYKTDVDENDSKKWLAALTSWGCDPVEINHSWLTKTETVNVINWYCQFALRRYLWENPAIVWLWARMVDHHPQKDDWLLLFVATHQTLSHVGACGHKLMYAYSNPRPLKEILEKYTTPTGWDWKLKNKTKVAFFWSSSSWSYRSMLTNNPCSDDTIEAAYQLVWNQREKNV